MAKEGPQHCTSTYSSHHSNLILTLCSSFLFFAMFMINSPFLMQSSLPLPLCSLLHISFSNTARRTALSSFFPSFYICFIFLTLIPSHFTLPYLTSALLSTHHLTSPHLTSSHLISSHLTTGHYRPQAGWSRSTVWPSTHARRKAFKIRKTSKST